jgi:hypothetical protein
MIGDRPRRAFRGAARLAPLALGALLTSPLRAETHVEASASVAAGVTDNALSAPSNTVQADNGADQFTFIRVGGRAFRVTRGLQHDLAYTFGTRLYAEHPRANSLSHALGWTSAVALSRATELRLQATVNYARINSANPLAIDSSGMPVGGSPTDGGATTVSGADGPVSYLAGSARETLTIRPTAGRLGIQSLGVSAFVPLATTDVSAIVAQHLLRGEVTRGRDTRTGELTLGLTWNPSATDSLGQQVVPTNRFLFGQVLVGGRRELSPAWSASAEVGGMSAFRVEGGPIVVGPAWRAVLRYRRDFGQASLELARNPQPNVFLGEALVADRVSLRLAVPLDRRQRFFLLGLGSYQNGRLVTEPSVRGPFQDGLAVRAASGALAFRPQDVPVAVSLDYSFFDQEGRVATATARGVAPITRQAVMLVVTGTLRENRPRDLPFEN